MISLAIFKAKPAVTEVSAQLRVGKKSTRFLIYLVLVIASLTVLLPIFWLLSTSLKTQQELAASIWGLPKAFHFENYVRAWVGSKMDIYMMNSIYVVAVTIILTIITCAPMSFVLARFKHKANRFIYYIIIAGMMVPIHSAVIPLYMMAMDLKMMNNLTALGTIYAAFRIPVSVFILESFMSTIPKELEECAVIDGCSVWKIFSKIILPLSVDGIATISILAVLASWNELLVAMLMLSKPTVKTLPIGLMGFITEYGAEYTQLASGLLIAIIPSIVFYLLAQEKIVKGMTAGAIKG